MSTQKSSNINQLLGQFLDLQDQWESAPENFDWEPLRALASAGADFYNEGKGLSFQILAIDGMNHGEFHLRFLEYSLEAGFDPFKLVRIGAGDTVAPVFAHESLASAAQRNPFSARMQACIRNLARTRFGSIENENTSFSSADLAGIMEWCRDSIPADVIEKLSDTLVVA